MSSHPTVNLRLTLDKKNSTPVDVTAVADTGAQSDIWSLEHFLKAGFRTSDLSPATLSLHAANKSPIKIDGVFRAKLTGAVGSRNEISCRSMIYVSRDIKCLYLSYDSMLRLGVINRDFPAVGTFKKPRGYNKKDRLMENSNLEMDDPMPGPSRLHQPASSSPAHPVRATVHMQCLRAAGTHTRVRGGGVPD